MRVPVSLRLVIDANLARAAGGSSVDSTADGAGGPGIACREFLIEVREGGHVLARCEAIRKEWAEQMSKFSRTWLTAMEARGQILDVPVSMQYCDELAERIHASNPRDLAKSEIEKDLPYVAVALEADKILASNDRKLRRRLGRALDNVPQLAELQWVNPAEEPESGIEWLRRGAPMEAFRRVNAGG